MSKLGLKRAPRIEVTLRGGEKLQLRPITALDVSELVKIFDLETVELTTRIINHVQSGKPIEVLFTDPQTYSDLIGTLPDLCAHCINLCAGGDDDDLLAIRELAAEDFALLVAKMVAHSLERIGGLGNLLDLVTGAAREINSALEAELQKRRGTNSLPQSGEQSPSSKRPATKRRKPTV